MEPTRRDFVKSGTAAIFFAAAGCSLFIKKREPDLTVAIVDGRIRVPADRLEEALLIAVPDEDRILVFRRPDGSIQAVSAVCTHIGCDVEYVRDSDRIECPCHGSEFDADGTRRTGPAKKSLKNYPASVSGNEVVVQVVVD